MKIIDTIYKHKLNILFFIIPVLQLVMVEMFDGSFEVSSLLIPFNLIFYYGFVLFGIFLIKNYQLPIIFTSVFWYIFGLVNEAVYQFRGIPIFPSDIFSVRTGLSVAGNYKFSITKGVVISSIMFISLIPISFCYRNVDYFKIKKSNKTRKRIGIRMLTTFTCLMVMTGNTLFIQSNSFFPTLKNVFENINDSEYSAYTFYNDNGFPVAFLKLGADSKIEIPTGYDKEQYKDLYEFEENKEFTGPNIIVIMNEAFSDLSVLGNLETNKEYLSFTKSNRVKSGKLNVSVKGGNTANTELEFLTGVSMASFPRGTVPYQTYIKNKMITLPSVLSKYNYDTYVFHPFGAQGWNRQSVYQYFEFNHIFFEDELSKKIASGRVDLKTIRGIVSDKTTYDCVIDDFENRDKSKNFFEFCVTLQNHGGYDGSYDDLPFEIKAKGETSKSELNTYLNLINESDKAFQEFVSYFEKQNEPTVILMFGDHQPADSVVEKLYDTTAPTIPDGITSLERTFLWCNSLTTAPTIPNSVTSMLATFQGCSSLTTAPTIPNGVTNMVDAFCGCTSLTAAPIIPSNVIYMDSAFYECTSLTGTIEVNANPTSYDDCLGSTQITGITGSCSQETKDALMATK